MTMLRTNWPLLLAAVLVAVGLTGFLQAHQERSSAAADNLAVVDADATAKVQSAVSRTLTEVLSFDHSAPERTQAAAETLLFGDAQEEHATLFETLKKKAPGQKLVLTAQVQAVGVKELTEDTAKLLVFLDQSSQRAGDKEASVSAAQLAVKAKKVDGAWKVTSLKPL